MKMHHVGLWVKDLEKQREFYEKFFDVFSGKLYVNKSRGFRSYFLYFDSGAAIEIMHQETLAESSHSYQEAGHLAIDMAVAERVDLLTDKIRAAGYRIVSEPRITGDGYYESVVADPEGNLIELVADPGR
ncbi:MAG: VOC family protein [Spirochaetales bacterium]|nr:VOC family protein [Spirochaetales bacterium]